VKSLLAMGPDLTRSELIVAGVQAGSLAITRALLEAGAGGKDEALGEAKDPSIAKALVDAGAVPSDTTLAKLSDITIAKAILASGTAAHGAGGQIALWNAAFEGNAALVHLLLEKGADPNAPLPGGRTPLLFETSGDRALRPPCPMVAAIGGFHLRAEIVRDLLKHKTDPNCGFAAGGLTPLAAWVRRSWTKGPDGALDVLHALVAAGADPGLKSARGTTAIEEARNAAAQDGGAHPVHGGNARKAWRALCGELKGELKSACSAKL
jgi:hypothetical protein